MLRIHKFVEDLANARKTPKEIKTMVDTAFEVNSISQSQIYRISALVKAGKDSSDKRSTNGRRKVRTDDFIEAVRVYVEADRRVTMEELAIKFETSINTIFHVLHDDLGLSIKSARWIPKMLTEDHKMKRLLRQLRRDLPALSPVRTSVTVAVFKDVMNMFLKKFKEK
ncbi:Uncharacterized protein FKW44_007604 [Caligus rogercresseyi]|uniref:Histone-lysine N-methyltransferase SETMAR n=1 Tax=Caligus rogercresseyi TaxID=217165 RepID=A0A7T8KEY5_CALRO|nr:Uncharacterized protein FKW44_007604 [Caligus rogercresseyi]